MTIDKKRLIAVLGMMGSDGDGEALNAARLASKMVRESGLTWNQIVNPSGNGRPVSTPDYRTPPSKRGTQRYGRPASQRRADTGARVSSDDIEDMMNVVGERKHDMGTLMFLAGLRQDWESRGSLSTDQYAALRRIHDGPRGGGSWRW